MNARDTENNMLKRYAAVARDPALVVAGQQEANVFRIAAMGVRSRLPRESMRLMQASQAYFRLHPEDQIAAAEVVRKAGRELAAITRHAHATAPLDDAGREAFPYSYRAGERRARAIQADGGALVLEQAAGRLPRGRDGGAPLHGKKRITTDVDAEFGSRVLVPNDLMVEVTLEDGSPQLVHLDKIQRYFCVDA